MSLITKLMSIAQQNKNKVILTCNHEQRTYEQFLQNAWGISDQLAVIQSTSQSFSKEIFHPFQVGILMNNNISFLELFIGINAAKALPVIMDPSWMSEQLEAILENYSLLLIFLDDITEEKFSKSLKKLNVFFINVDKYKLKHDDERKKNSTEELLEYSRDDPLFIGFTSGSTSVPKGFIQRHSAWEKSIVASEIEFKLPKETTIIAPGPLSHSLTVYAALEGLLTGRKVTLLSYYDPLLLASYLETNLSSSLVVVPTMLRRFIIFNKLQPKIFSNVLTLITSSSKLDENTEEDILSIFPNCSLFEYYGASELGFVSIRSSKEKHPRNSVGRAFLGVSVQIRGNRERQIRKGEAGSIWVKSPYIMEKYVGDSNEISGYKANNGWATVGDRGYLDDKGYLYLVGREDELIITGGLHVYPGEVENVLKNFDGVEEAFVFGESDEYWGTKVCALLVLKKGKTFLTEKLKEFCKQHLSFFKCPKVFFECENLPLTSNGKISRSLLFKRVKNRQIFMREII